MSENTSIIASGQKIDIGCRVILWDEADGFSFYKSGKYSPRSDTLEKLQKEIDCFVLHHSVTYTAKLTFGGLIGRGLSVNFIIDDDNVNGYATIFQCLDIKDVGWSHKPLNFKGPGVEISYQPTAWTLPGAYSENNINKYGVQHHDVIEDTIHGVKRKVFGPTEAQIKSCIALLSGFCQIFPLAVPEFPKDQSGKIIKTVSKNKKGLLAHFNVTGEKIDPMGFPFERVENEIANKLQPSIPEKQAAPELSKSVIPDVEEGSLVVAKPGLWEAIIKYLSK